MKRFKMARAVSIILASVLLASSVTGCGGKESVSNDAKLETEKISIAEEDSTEKKSKEESTAAKETKSKEPEVYSISSSTLINKTREFFREQAQQTYNSNFATYETPISIGRMKSSNFNVMQYISPNYDEAHFGGLQDSYEVIDKGLTRMQSDGKYDLTVTNVANGFNDNYRYYLNTDAVLDMVIKLTVSSSNPHDSRQADITGEGYFLVQYVLGKGAIDDWRIDSLNHLSTSKVESSDLKKMFEPALINEDDAKVIANISADVEPWRQAYIEAIASLPADNNQYPRYRLIYVDGDDIPELVYEGSSTGDGMCLFSFYDGQITENRLELSSIYYIEKENKIYISDGRMGSYSDVVYKLNQGVLEIQEIGIYGDAYNEKHERIDGYEYTWNDVNVTEEQYYNLVEQAFDKAIAKYESDVKYKLRDEMIDFLNTGDISAPIVSTKKSRDASSNETAIASSEDSNTVSDYQVMRVVNCNESITLRTSPSTKAGEICQIPMGATVSYIESAGDGFYKIMYNGSIGYALASYLELQ